MMEKRTFRVIYGLAIAYVCLITLSVPFESVKPGLDESWAWALNAIPGANYIFGKDVVFTYGPWGFLMCPRPLGQNFWWASGFIIFIQTIFAALLVVLGFRART